VRGDAVKMNMHLEDLDEIWETMDTCYERQEKNMAEAWKPILKFRRYRVYNSCAVCAVRKFYSLLRAAVKEAKAVGHNGLLISNQTILKIIGKMPFTDWKEWATPRPEWIHQDIETLSRSSWSKSGRMLSM
jgi:hypothetical protein